MNLHTRLIPILFATASLAACRDANKDGTRDEPSAGIPAAARTTQKPSSEPIPVTPSVIGVNTTHVKKDGALVGMRIAILATDGFEQSELVGPRQAYADEGADTFVISPKTGEIQGYKHSEKADRVKVDLTLDEADPNEFDALQLPGGVVNGDHLRLYPQATKFVSTMARSGRPVAAICHGLWLMADADVVKGRTLTSWPTLKTDLTNAGAKWVDREVVEDKNFVTSRKPDDLPAFNQKAIALFAKQRTADRPAIGGGPIPE